MSQWGCGIRAHGVGIKIKERPISTPFAMPQFGEVFFFNEMTGYPTATQPVSLEHELRTADCGLGIQYGLGIRRGLQTWYKIRTTDYVGKNSAYWF